MVQTTTVNRQVLLASRPVGAPTESNFSLAEGVMPTPKEGEILLRTIFLSLDPYMRGRMSADESYAAPVEINAPMVGGTVCRVETSLHPDYQKGDWVVSFAGWQDYSISNGEGLIKLPAMANPSYALGVLGMPGFTGYMGLLDIGQPKKGRLSLLLLQPVV